MRIFALLLFHFSLVLSTITCPSGQVYLKFTKKTTIWGNEESWEIADGQTTLYTSPTLQNNDLRVIEECIASSTGNQYKLKLKDSAGDSWSAGAWFMIQGLYGNIVFKNYLSAPYEEEFDLSLYYPIMKNEQYKFTSGSVSGDWTSSRYEDSTWTTITAGSVSSTYEGTQYFRKQFTGLSGMAAYEASFRYRYGIIAHLNGVEIYRDNMPEGPVSSSTPATGGYTTVDDHALIRPGNEIQNGQLLLAVELHFTTTTATSVDFDMVLALLKSTVVNEPCFIYPYNTTLTATVGSNGSNVEALFDFDKTSSYSVDADSLPVTLSYAFQGPRLVWNRLRIWPYTSPASSPSSFLLQGSHDDAWNTVIAGEGILYETSKFRVMDGYFHTALYNHYRLQLTGTSGSTLTSYEIQPAICVVTSPTSIEFDASSYTFYARYESVHIQPIVNEFTNCQISPELAAGLVFDSITCTLSGIVPSALPLTTYSVSSVMNNQTFVGTFQLQVTECTGTVVNALRIYKSSATRESFEIKETASQQVVLSVAANSGQINNSEQKNILCLTSTLYTVSISSSSSYWQAGSFLFIQVLLAGDTDTETILRLKYDTNLGISPSYSFNAQLLIQPVSQWHYVLGSVPTNWYDASTTDWLTANAGSIPPSTNQLQLYKKTFSVTSLAGIMGVVISLKYQYGVLIYLNNHEVFRKGISGPLGTDSFASTSLPSVNFRQISLPVRTVSVEGSSPLQYIQQGENRIAIALVAPNADLVANTFDCVVRLMAEGTVHRGFDYSYTFDSIDGSPEDILEQHYTKTVSSSTCSDNFFEITFNDDRHEWISSILLRLYYTQTTNQPTQFVIKAKNAEDTAWKTLKTVTQLGWSLAGQKNRIWIPNNEAFNQYRFENFATGDSTQCAWQFNTFDLLSDDTTVTVPELTYASTSIFKDIEMGEIYPSSDAYTDFSITPALPAGVHLDPNTGILSGTAHEVSAATAFTITAKKFNTGESVSVPFALTVEVCYGGKSLITMVVRTDSSPTQSSYKLYRGKRASGTPISSVDSFYVSNTLVYGDFCLEHNLYTLEFLDTSIGWNAPAGYYLTVDVGAMKFEMGQVYKLPAPASVTTSFSSFLPFQVEYDEWKVFKHAVASDWNTLEFDDSDWTGMKAASIGTSEFVTVYIRRDISLPSVEDYHVLNVRVKYAGGVVCYFNGRKVARFNLEEDFDADTESIEVHDATVFSQFHIVLSTVGAVTGKNVIAFEIHRPKGQSSAESVVFDATGVFGVNDCSIGVDSIIHISGTSSTIGELSNYFDLTPVTYGYQANAIGTYLEWSVENLEGTKFNSFALETTNVRSSWGFSLYGRQEEFVESEEFTQTSGECHQSPPEEYTSMFSGVNLGVVTRGRAAWEVPVGIAGFRQFKHEVDDTASANVIISAYIFQYCKAESSGFCPAVGDFPSVAEGQISPGECGDGYRGYAYRICTNGVLGAIQMDKCIYKIPAKLQYDYDHFNLVVDAVTSIAPPTYQNIITRFYLDDNIHLPEGLTLHSETGAITGKVTSLFSAIAFTIYGENPVGVTSTTLTLSSRKGLCLAEGTFPRTEVGETAVFDCSSQGLYFGSQSRKCVLGEKDGVWEETQGMCISVVLVIVLVVIVLLVIVFVVVMLVKTKKNRAVGGVKGKKSGNVAKKNVKVWCVC